MRILYVNILWLLSSGVLSDNPAQNQDERLVFNYNENSSENGTVEIVGMKRNNYDQGLCRSQFKELFERFNSGDTWARKGTYIYCFIYVIRNRISYAIPKFLQMLGFLGSDSPGHPLGSISVSGELPEVDLPVLWT